MAYPDSPTTRRGFEIVAGRWTVLRRGSIGLFLSGNVEIHEGCRAPMNSSDRRLREVASNVFEFVLRHKLPCLVIRYKDDHLGDEARPRRVGSTGLFSGKAYSLLLPQKHIFCTYRSLPNHDLG